MVVVVRGLSIGEFAQYSILIAFVEIGVALSGFGIAQVALRYVPELYVSQQLVVLEKLLARLVTVRSLSLLLFLTLCFLLSPWIVDWVGLQGALGAFKVFLLIVFFRGTAYLLSQILESTLHQGWTQVAFSVSSAAKLSGAVFLLWSDSLTLLSVVWLEAIADLLAVAVLSLGMMRGGLIGPTATAQDQQMSRTWFARNTGGLLRFAATGYLQHLAILPYGGHMNRLVGGATLSTLGMANFGFAQALYEYIKRYLPAQLLMGMVRPVVIARYEQTGDFAAAVRTCSQIMQINVIFCGLIAVAAAVGGEKAFWLLTNGKYTQEALQIFLALLVVLVLETHRQQIDLLIQITKRYEDLIGSNAVVSASVLLAIVLVSSIGGSAFPLANALGLIGANWLALYQMQKRGFKSAYDWASSASVALASLVSVGAGWGLLHLGVHWLLATTVACLAFVGMAYFFLSNLILSFWKNTTSGTTVPMLIQPTAASSQQPTRVAFGVLSSKHSVACVEQIADAVYPHPVYVHHDFTKVPAWSSSRPNVHTLLNPVQTAWGDWSLVAATLRLMEEAALDDRNTHFQLLSESCLPIRPVKEFIAYLEHERPDFMIEMRALNDIGMLRSHGWRYLCRPGIFRRIFRKLSVTIYPWSHRRVMSGVNVNIVDLNAKAAWQRWIVDNLMKMTLMRLESSLGGAHGCTMAVGSQWMGMSMQGVRYVLKLRDESPALMQHFQSAHIPDESFFQTIVMTLYRSNPDLRVAGSNHALFWLSNGTGPDEVDEKLLSAIADSGKFFARKFSLDSESTVRGVFLRTNERQHETR